MTERLTALIEIGETTLLDIKGKIEGSKILFSRRKGPLAEKFPTAYYSLNYTRDKFLGLAESIKINKHGKKYRVIFKVENYEND